jgi:hypothetical protein
MKRTLMAVLLLMGMAQGYTVTQNYPTFEVIQRGDKKVEIVIIATSMKGIWIPCHAAISFPTPKGLR